LSPTWLEADPPDGDAGPARTVLESWAGLLGTYFTEHQLVDGLVGDLVIAWNRLAFLNSISALMRTTINPLDRSLMSIKLAAQALEVENAFLGFTLPEGVKMFWVSPTVWDEARDQLLDMLNRQRHPLWYNDPESCRQALPGLEGIRSFVGHKIQHGDAPAIYIGAFNRIGGSFNAGDIQIFDSLIEMLTSFMESSALHERDLEIESLNRDLRIAAEIQASFLPSRLPRLEGHQIAASMIPASMLGGDLCDIVECGPGHVAVIVCDVAGKGVGAALLAAELRAILRSEVRKPAQPDEILQNVNTVLLEDMERNERFATTLLMILGPGGQPPRYASAGHTTGLLVHGETLEVARLTSSTVPLGVLAELDGGYKTIDFDPGDVLLIYSDGLTETQNEHGDLLGLDGVLSMLLGMHHAPAQMIVDSLIGATNRHRGSATLQDDLTLVVVKRLPSGYVDPIFVDYFILPGERSMLAVVEAKLAVLRGRLPPGEAMDKWLLQIQLAVTEAVSNIIIHAYAGLDGEIIGLITLYPDRLEVDLLDGGVAFEPRDIVRREIDIDHLDEGGRGLSIVHDVMDEVAYRRVADRHNYWKLGRRIPGAARSHTYE
jgi:serine phosphatase RsbU (regulator of sigma subunit)/anti-sigma regulatory factor (Ser/Thr protein kinase)